MGMRSQLIVGGLICWALVGLSWKTGVVGVRGGGFHRADHPKLFNVYLIGIAFAGLAAIVLAFDE
jgi:hypothetical protein